MVRSARFIATLGLGYDRPIRSSDADRRLASTPGDRTLSLDAIVRSLVAVAWLGWRPRPGGIAAAPIGVRPSTKINDEDPES